MTAITRQNVMDAWGHLLDGDPGALEGRAAELQKAASAILQSITALNTVAFGQESEATDALQQSAEKVGVSLRAAAHRYDGTGKALQTFSIELAPIQGSARTHIDMLVEAEADVEYADVGQRDASARLTNGIYGGASDAEVERLRDDLDRANARTARAYDNVTAAISALQGDDRAREDAADRAIRAIDAVIGANADSALDNLRQFVDGAVSLLADVTGWPRAVLAEVVHRLLSELANLVTSALWAMLILLALGMVLASPVALGVVAGLLLTFVLRETLATPIRHEWSETDTLGMSYPTSAEAAQDYGDLIDAIVRKDSSGKAAGATDIQVVAITNEAGEVVAWRVQLPSTQFWDPFNNQGVNDLCTDAILSLFPGIETQYEKAALDAMDRAGVNLNDAPIMFTGWSLGGMVAGKLATNPLYADRVGAVVTAGSAVDKYASEYGPQVNVTQINNLPDAVHHLEFGGWNPSDVVQPPRWKTYWIDDPRFHDGEMYAQGADDVVPQPRPGDERFFADPLAGTHEVVRTERYSRQW